MEKDYNLRIPTYNIQTLNRDGVTLYLMATLVGINIWEKIYPVVAQNKQPEIS